MPDDFETFFEPTRIFLFGKKFSSLRYYPESMRDEFSKTYFAPGNGEALPIPPKRVERTLRRGLKFDQNRLLIEDAKRKLPFFARIYSFSYEAHYYRLPRPLLFLVNDEGAEVGGARGEQPGEQDNTGEEGGGMNSSGASKNDASQPQAPGNLATNSDAPHDRSNPTASKALNPEAEAARRRAEDRLNRNRHIARRFSAQFTGVEARDWDFANDILVWRVDRKDLAVCLDVEVGNYQEILLDSMISSSRQDEDRATRSRGDIIGRGASSFRGDIIGPHQNK